MKSNFSALNGVIDALRLRIKQPATPKAPSAFDELNEIPITALAIVLEN